METSNQCISRLLVDYDMYRRTPTMRRNPKVTLEHELGNRRAGALLIQNAAVFLGLGEDAIYHAQFLFQRLYYIVSMDEYPMSQVIVALLFLSAKLNEQKIIGGDVLLAVDRALKHYHHNHRVREFAHLSYLLTQAKDHNLNYIPGIGPVTTDQIQLMTDTIEEYKQYSPDRDILFLQHPRVTQALAMLAPMELDIIQKLAFKLTYPALPTVLSDIIAKLELPPAVASKAVSLAGVAHSSPAVVAYPIHVIATAAAALAASLHGMPLPAGFALEWAFEDLQCKVREGMFTLVWMHALAKEQGESVEYPCVCSEELKSAVRQMAGELGVTATEEGYEELHRRMHDDEVYFDKELLSVGDQEQLCYWMTEKYVKEVTTMLLSTMSEENYRYLPVSDEDAYNELTSMQLADVKAELYEAYSVQPVFDIPPL